MAIDINNQEQRDFFEACEVVGKTVNLLKLSGVGRMSMSTVLAMYLNDIINEGETPKDIEDLRDFWVNALALNKC